MMLPLDSEKWEDLEHAYGSAEEVPDWLNDLATGDQAEAMSQIWSSLYHQGTVYSATIAAVPHMVKLAKQLTGSGRLELVMFSGLVASSAEKESDVDEDILVAYKSSIQNAAALAVELFSTTEMDRDTTIHLLSATAALHGCASLGQTLQGFSAEEFTTDCPKCDKCLYVWPMDEKLSVAADDPVSSPDTPKADVVPNNDTLEWDGAELTWKNSLPCLSVLATRASDTKTAALLPYLYGVATCPSCGNQFNLIERLTEAG